MFKALVLQEKDGKVSSSVQELEETALPAGDVTDAATVLPVQIFLWADSPERAFVEKTSAAIIVLLGFLVIMNALAVILRRRFERRW